MSEALILASTNPQYDDRLFIELRVQYVHENYKLSTCVLHKLFFAFVLTFRTICGLVDARISASDKDLPVQVFRWQKKIRYKFNTPGL